MRDLYSDDYESVAGDGADRLIPDGVRRLTGAAIFVGLIAALGLWSYRLGTRDAAQVPIIKAMEGPARVQPDDPGGLKAAHQGLEVNAVLAGRQAPTPAEAPPARPEPPALASEDAPQGELIAAAPAVLARQVLGEDGELPMPPDDGPSDAAVPGMTPASAVAEVEAPAAEARPRNRPANLSVAHAKVTPVASAQPVATPAAAVAAPAPAGHEVSRLRPGTRLVQLGAFDSEDITRKAWANLVARNPDLLGSKSLYVERTTANARVFYRLRVAGFGSAEETRQICEALRARSVACIPVTLQQMGARAVIFGCGGPVLAAEERRFFAAVEPWGFILFTRNVASTAQLQRLTQELRASVGRDAPVLIDQEGGRVARLRGPVWREWLPALEECARLPGRDLRARAMYLRYRLIAGEMRAAGLDVNCAPVLDLVQAETHAVLRNRCYGGDPDEVAAIGRAVAAGLLDGGVLPVMKHLPGQGRAARDSHLDLPEVTTPRAMLAADFAPFRVLGDLPMAMTAHVVYTALDPEAPATQSARVVRLIREEIGFDGLLMTDDLSMQALRGTLADRAVRALAAGCDLVLHCNGDAGEMSELAEVIPPLAGVAAVRAEAALARRRGEADADPAALAAEFAELGDWRVPEDAFDVEATAARLEAEALVVDVDGYEGPLDLLLTLARGQKVDLRRISILKLAEQYLGFVEAAKRLRIELAADYLVMAAWLAYLKSRLLLPPDPTGDEPSGDDMAAHLAFQLQRLEAMRDAAGRLMARDQLGRDVFARGEPQGQSRELRVVHTATLVDLMRAYARIKTRDDFTPLHLARGSVYTMEQALERMRGLIGAAMDWVQLAKWLPEDWAAEPARRRSATAASFAAALELAKAGRLHLRQDGAFQPIWLRQRRAEDAR